MALRAIFKKLTLKQHFPIIIFRNNTLFSGVLFRNNTLLNGLRLRKTTPNCFINKQFLCSNNDSDSGESDDEICELNEQISIRNLLNADLKDPLIQKLNESASVQNVFNIIRENDLKADHITQAVLVLWDLQKIFYKHNSLFENENNGNSVLSTNAILKKYIDQVNAHEDFGKLLQLIENNYQQLSIDALTCTLLYLNRIGVKLNTKVMQLMIAKCEKDIKNGVNSKPFPLTALSRFIVTVNTQEHLWPILVSINALPIILERLETCTTAKDFKLLTICLNKMIHLVTTECVCIYKTIAIKLINENLITNDNKRTIIKILRFLNQPQWFEYNTDISTKYMLLLKNHVDQLNNQELLIVFKVFQMQKEPADMLEEFQNHALTLLSKIRSDGDVEPNLEMNFALLSCSASYSPSLQRSKFESIANAQINNNLTPLSLSALYKILYHIKPSDTKLCNRFWDKLLKFLNTNTSSTKFQNLLSICHKYINFNDIGNRYRYYHFEKAILTLLKYELDYNVLELNHSQYFRIAAFIIAYSNDSSFIEQLINTIINQSDQLTAIDCLNLSKGYQYAFENNRTRNDLKLASNLKLLAETLSNFTLNESNKNFDIPKVNMLLRSFVLRKDNIECESFKNLLRFYEHSNEFSSHMVRDLTFALQVQNCLNPDAIDKSIEYILEKKENILGNTVDKVLYLCYSLGYTPKNADDFFEITTNLIIRDKERFSGLAFLQSCLALGYFHKLPEDLIKLVFSVEFLEKLDEELANCYAKTTYPYRVRDHLMQLNRAVCLDYPESNIPWFHQKYVDELQKQARKQDFFHKKILSTLEILTQETKHQIIENSYSPYGYQLDFELEQDLKNSEKSKIVIILLASKSFTSLTPNLKGYYQLKQRHLEILGYNVIRISYSDWKCLYTQENYTEFIKNKIWPSTDSVLSSMSY